MISTGLWVVGLILVLIVLWTAFLWLTDEPKKSTSTDSLPPHSDTDRENPTV